MEQSNFLKEWKLYSAAFGLPVLILLAHLLRTNLEALGLYFPLLPRTVEGLPGILGWVFFHGDWKHLWGNMSSLLVLGLLLRNFAPEKGLSRLIGIWVLAGFWTWLIARPSTHIGASGIVYGYLSYILFASWWIRNRRYLALSFVLVFLYGSAVWGIFPVQEGVSWEGHLCGALAGVFMAWLHRSEWNAIRSAEALKKQGPSEMDGDSESDPYREMRQREQDWGEDPERWL